MLLHLMFERACPSPSDVESQGIQSLAAINVVLFVHANLASTVTCSGTSCGTVRSHSCCLCRNLSMARLGKVAELVAFLGKLDPDYAQYAAALWQKGVRTSRQLSNASQRILLFAGLPELHVDDIQASCRSELCCFHSKR
ncbi:hypothetical protein ABBQ38_015035 [Trebouxia sp. C0009 RCD-2024]